MWLDADDIISPRDLDKLIALKQTLSGDVDIVTMKYILSVDDRENPTMISTRERLLKRDRGFLWQDPVHECIPLSGNIFTSDIAVRHNKLYAPGDPDRNLRIYQNLIDSGRELSPRQLFYFARELKDHRQFEAAAEYFTRFLDTQRGWSEDNISACFNAALCLRNLGNPTGALNFLMKSFEYDGPRAEICCEIGYHYKTLQDYRRAISWFETATVLVQPNTAGFLMQDYWGYVPHIELCVCFYSVGNLDRALFHNEKALEIKPFDRIALGNRMFFQKNPQD